MNMQLAPFGLLSPAVTVIRPGDTSWEGGFEYETLGSVGITTLESSCTSASASISDGSDATKVRNYKPFLIRTVFSCSPFSRSSEELERLARTELEIVAQKAIEREFWTGTLAEAEVTASGGPANRYLSDGGATSLSASAVKPRLGLALLEGALGFGGNGAQGVIHLPRSAAEAMDLGADGEVLRTKLRTPVVAGVGYTTDPLDTTVTLYGTGSVEVRLGEFHVDASGSQVVDRSVNTLTVYADAVASVAWDSDVHWSVDVDLTLDY